MTEREIERENLIELLDIIIQPGEKTLGDIADCLLANNVLVLPCKVGDTIWVIDREDGEAVDISGVIFLAKSKGCIIATAQINDYNLDETILYHINETQDNFDTRLMVYSDDDCFLTKEEAVKALHKINHNSLCETETYNLAGQG